MPKNYRRNNRNSGRRDEPAESTPATLCAQQTADSNEDEAMASPNVPPTPPPTPAVSSQNPAPPTGGDGEEMAALEATNEADKAAAAAAHEQEASQHADEAEAEAEGEADPEEGGVVGPGSAAAAAEAQQHARDIVAAEDANSREHRAEHEAEAERSQAEGAAAELATHHHVSMEERQSRSREDRAADRPKLDALGVNSTLAAAADPAHSPTYTPGRKRFSQSQPSGEEGEPEQTPASVSSRCEGRHVTISPTPVVMGEQAAPSPSHPAPTRHASELVPLRRAESTAVPAAAAAATAEATRERSWPRASAEEDRGEAAKAAPARVQPVTPAAGRVWWCDVAIALGAAAFVARCI